MKTSDAAPMFILGPHRCGTTKMASYFKDIHALPHLGESHVWRLAYHIRRGVEEIVGSTPPNAFTFNQIGGRVIENELHAVLDTLLSAYFHGERWVDKTPGHQMVHVAPIIAAYYPRASFVFMQRRGVETVMSNLKKWPRRAFNGACRMWAEPMGALLEVREQMGDRLLVIDQRDLLTDPVRVHRAVSHHTGLDAANERRAVEFFGSGNAQTTSTLATDYVRLEETGWDSTQRETFERVCGELMTTFGYAM